MATLQVVVTAAMTWCWWLSIVFIHPCCVPQAGHGGGNNTYNTNVSYKKSNLKEFEKQSFHTAQEMLLTSLGPFFFCPSFVPTAYCLGAHHLLFDLTAHFYQVLL